MHRRVLAFAVLIALTGCGGRETAKVCAAGPTVAGVDVSHSNGPIDWATAAHSGIQFAFVKATEGLTFTDPQFATNWRDLKRNGVLRGAYHFFRPMDDGTMQADAFLAVVGLLGQPGDLPPVLDWEVTDNLSSAQAAREARKFIDEIQTKTGLPTIIYTGPSFFSSLDLGDQFSTSPLWIANWGAACPSVPIAWSSWVIWQHADDGSVPGISGPCDLDTFNGTLAELQQLGLPTH